MNMKIVEMTSYEIAKAKYKGFGELINKYDDSSLNSLAEELIKADIIWNKWHFDGNYHQNGKFGTYVFEDSDGDRYFWSASMRYFGELMADVWNRIDKKNSYNYMDFYMGVDSDIPLFHVPSNETEFRIKNKMDFETVNCTKCGKPITQSEYCINWGTCRECFDKEYDDYLKSKEKSGN